jgi:alpha-L-fucosidase
MNAGFDTGTIQGWLVSGETEIVADVVNSPGYALRLGEGPSSAEQTVSVQPGTKYRLSVWLRTGSGAEEVRVGVRGHGRGEKATAMSWVVYRQVDLFFSTSRTATTATVFLVHPAGEANAWADDVELVALGPAEEVRYDGVYNSIVVRPPRTLVTQLGVTQFDDDRMAPFMSMKFGMFVHWGLYAGPGRGEWLRYAEKIPQEKYEQLAHPDSGDEYFAADKYDPGEWARIARRAGMKWICLTARHHDGFNLFASPHPNAWHSGQTHRRDFFREYVDGLRREGISVGMYYSPLNWRYPGVFDIHGTGAKPNNLGFSTHPSNRENARLFKEENYANVRHLLTQYGPIDSIFWDGGWLAHSGTDADAAPFHESGLFMDPANEWPVDPRWLDFDAESGRPLGIMGMVRKHQPHCITNTRYGWYGDIHDEEQGPPPTGPIRTQPYGKCITMGSSWGYSPARTNVYSLELLIEYLVNSACRNMVFMLNVGPDRHGVIPAEFVSRLEEIGHWLSRMGESIYATQPGPWDPEDGVYGYMYRGRTLFVHLLSGHMGSEFRLPPVGDLRPVSARHVWDARPVPFTQAPDRTVLLSSIDRSQSPADTVIAIEFDQPIYPEMPR